jgi:hypothetical protein
MTEAKPYPLLATIRYFYSASFVCLLPLSAWQSEMYLYTGGTHEVDFAAPNEVREIVD